jgi:hypothetical protein
MEHLVKRTSKSFVRTKETEIRETKRIHGEMRGKISCGENEKAARQQGDLFFKGE